ncbi:MAG: hypothetical protein IT203_03410 [Fimbriimonadaceae bacterium]|nr:hypothetical protein [Fimbriimonadaceae bacterium]
MSPISVRIVTWVALGSTVGFGLAARHSAVRPLNVRRMDIFMITSIHDNASTSVSEALLKHSWMSIG